MADGKVVYDITGDNSQFSSAVGKTKDIAAKAFSGVESVGKAAFKGIATSVAAVGAALGLAVKSGVEYNAQLETYKTAFTTLLGDSEKAAKMMEQIKQDAAKTPFDVSSLTLANQLLVGAGVSAEDSRKTILALGDAVAATGGGTDELTRMAANLQQIKNVGKATAVDIKQFAMSGINVYAVLADYLGTTTDKVKEMDISYEDLSAALQTAASTGGLYFNAMENQSLTFNGQLSNLKDNISALLGDATTGIQNILKSDALPAVLGWVDQLQTAFSEGGLQGAVDAFGGIFGDALTKIIEYIPSFTDAAVSILAGMVGALHDNIGTISQAGEEILTAIVSGIQQMLPDFSGIIASLAPLAVETFLQYHAMLLTLGLTIISALMEGIANNLDQIISSADIILQTLVQTLLDNIPVLLDSAVAIIVGLGTYISENAEEVVGYVIQIINVIADALIENIPALAKAVVTIVFALLTALIEKIPDLLDTIAKINEAVILALIEIGEELFEQGKKLLQKLIDGVSEKIDNAANAIDEIGERMLDKIRDKIADFKEIGRQILAGMIQGIKDKVQDAVEAVTEAVGKVVKAAKRSLGINSPSKVFAEIGEYSTEGLAEGFDDGADKPTKMIQRVLGKVTGEARVNIPDLSALESGLNLTAASSQTFNLNNQMNGTITVDGYTLAKIVLKNLDDAAAYTLRG